MNAQGQLRETFTRGVGLAGDPAVAGLVAVTHHAGSWTNGTFYIHNNSDKSRAGHRGDPAMRGILTRSGTTTVGSYDYSVPRLRDNLQSQIGPDVCRFKFSSKEPDPSTGFYYYGYRFYAPQWQRWLSRDLIGEHGGLNLYGFVVNSPLTKIDRFGLQVVGYPGSGYPSWPETPVPEYPWECAQRIAEEVGKLPINLQDPSNRYHHCVASCRISRECWGGRFTAWIAGDWYQDPWWENDAEARGDRKANKVGRDLSNCKGTCEDLCSDALKNGQLY